MATSAAPPPKLGRRLRRSKRLSLTVPVSVFGQNASGQHFREFTHMISVNAHGGLLVLDATVQKGQTLILENRRTGEQQEFRVAYVGSSTNGKSAVGIELANGSVDFWRIYFPPLTSRV